jgi:hypothetical protein
VTIRFPNGRALRVADPALASELTRELGHAVTLADCTEMPLVDAAAVHLLTTGALAWLQTALPDAGIDARRFRPNLVIDTGNHAPIEHAWVDKAIRIGDTATLRVIERTERCGMVAMAQSELPDDPRVLRHITEYVGLEFGVYGEVLAAGRVRTGDSVTLLD